MASNATVRVQFGNPKAGENYYMSAEVDSRDPADGGLNGGVTSFLPGDKVAILVYRSANTKIDAITTSAGSASQGAVIDVVKKDVEVMFEDTKTASLPVPCKSISSYKWVGRNLGTPALTSDKQNIQVPTKGVAVLNLTVVAEATTVELTSPLTVDGLSDFTILVLIQGSPA